MSLLQKSRIRRKYTGIGADEIDGIKEFFRGAVYAWIKKNPGQVFTARDFVGGMHNNWGGTPLLCLFNKHKKDGKTDQDAVEQAGKDAGGLLKLMLDGDKYKYKSCQKGLIKGYLHVV